MTRNPWPAFLEGNLSYSRKARPPVFIKLQTRAGRYCVTIKRSRYGAWLLFASSQESYAKAWEYLCKMRPECRSLLA